jgi:hypothetical protein
MADVNNMCMTTRKMDRKAVKKVEYLTKTTHVGQTHVTYLPKLHRETNVSEEKHLWTVKAPVKLQVRSLSRPNLKDNPYFPPG